MAQVKYLDEAGLAKLVEEIIATFVKREYKTGSQTVYKVLSDNNLTDELVQKIKNAGSSSFSGAYSDLTGKPSIEGHEITSGSNTAASLGLATPSNVSAATKDMATKTYVAGLGYQTASQVNSAITSKGYATTTAMNAAVSSAKSELNSAITAAVSSVFKYKGVKANKSELPTTGNAIGDVWFVTQNSSEFAWNGTKWEEFGEVIDLSGYVLSANLVAITTSEIKGLFD